MNKIQSWWRKRKDKRACKFMILQAFEGNIWRAEELLLGWYQKLGFSAVEPALNKLVYQGIFRWQFEVMDGVGHLTLTAYGCRCAQYLKSGNTDCLG